MREKLNMNKGWKFFRGEIPYDTIRGHFATYMHAKAQSGQNAASELFYEGAFSDVVLPHDYVIEQIPSADNNESQGGYERENAWYRRTFRLNRNDSDKRIVLYFEGAGKNTEVWLNGHPVGQNSSMYNSFYMDLTPYVYCNGEENVIAVHITNDGDVEGWWYEGAGIYRNVWLIKTNKIALDMWGIRVKPKRCHGDCWDLEMDLDIYSFEECQKLKIVYQIMNPEGAIVCEGNDNTTIEFGKNRKKMNAAIQCPVLWDLEHCALYKVRICLYREEELLDQDCADFGFRDIKFDPNHGFFLNGNQLKLRGVCMHQDHGRLGVAVPANVAEYRIRKLKELGVNAYRCAHHNPDPAILNICDRLGMLVIDENRKFNFSEETQKQILSMCYRDMNHPSVILWSVGNEEPLQDSEVGKRLVESMKKFIHTIDPLRPVTIALNGGFYDSFAATASDVVAVNYRIDEYDKMHEIHPDKAIVATESGASNNNRGIYFEENGCERKGGYASAYDRKRVAFGSSYGDAIKQSETHEYIAGTFLWAGMEYRGEARWPLTICGSGIYDNCAMEKDNCYLVKSCWNKEPMLHIMPSWNLKGHEGEKVEVCLYTNLKEVELEVNGVKYEKRRVSPFEPVIYKVVYEPGEIKATGYMEDGKCLEKVLHTAGKPSQLCAKRCNSASDTGEDALIYELWMEDENGYICTDADALVQCQVLQGGKILSLDNGDPKDLSSSLKHERRMFSGKMQTIIRVEENAELVETQWNCSEIGLIKTESYIPQKKTGLKRVELCSGGMEIKNFRKWPDTQELMSINQRYDFNDMNTSEPVDLRKCQRMMGDGYEIYTNTIVIPKFDENKELFLKWKNFKGSIRVRIFHEKDCWPNPTPETFLDKQIVLENKEEKDTMISLRGFSANEKVHMILQVKKDGLFSVKGIFYHVQ